MSTTALLEGLLKPIRGGVPMKKKSPSKRAVNKVLDVAYRANVHRKGLRRNRLMYKQPSPDLNDFMISFSEFGLIKKKKTKTNTKDADVLMREPARRSGRVRTSVDRFSPTSAAKKDKENAKKLHKKHRSSKSPPKSRSTSPMELAFAKMRF